MTPTAHNLKPNGTAPGMAARLAGRAREARLLARVRERWHAAILEACCYSSVPPGFITALIANESAGDASAVRFEPRVYRQLAAVAAGKAARYGSLTRAKVEAEIADMLHPKAASFHSAFLTAGFGEAHREQLARTPDEALRELATSWGLTQIMGYHLVGRAGTPRDLFEPRFALRLTLELLAEFAERFELNLARDFAEMFHCWNTGQPYGATADPAYVDKGLWRMEMIQYVSG